MDKVNTIAKNFNNCALHLPKVILSPLQDACKSAGIEIGVIPMVSFGLSLLYLLIFYGASIMFTTLTLVYPCYMSILAIESKSGDDDKTWLAFWLLYAFSYLWEITLGPIFASFIPLYNVWRVLYFVYLMMP